MVGNYRRKTNKASYSKETLRAAVAAVKNGHLSGYKAAQMYQIPRMTIMDHVYNRRNKSTTLGRNTALSPELEANLVSLLHLMEKYGFGLSKEEVLQLVGDYVKKNSLVTPFKNGIPGAAWFAGFKSRHNLSIKKPQGVEYARKRAMDPFIVSAYFDLLWKTMSELNITNNPSAIWNLDETSFSQDPAKTKVVGIKGHASTRVISSPGKNNTTVLLGACADGNKTPPLIIFKGKNVWDEWVSPDAYPGTSYAATTNGWMETEVFEMFFKKTFLPTVGNQRPILLIYDGHATHVGLNIIEEARKNGITILKLPPHTSDFLQPLDVSVMKSFKDRWDALLVKWQRLNVGITLPKKEFGRLIGVVWAQIERTTLINGFRKAAIFPWNPEEIKDDHYDALKLKKWKELKEQNTLHEGTDVDTTKKNPPILEVGTTKEDPPSLEVGTTKRNPPTLISLALDSIIKEMSQCAPISTIPQGQATQDREPEPLILNGEPINNPSTSNLKVTILEDKKISFEELLLLQVKAGNNTKSRRQKMAPGAEVITHDDVIKRKKEEQLRNIKIGSDARKTTIKLQPKPNKLKNSKNLLKRRTQRKDTKDNSTPENIAIKMTKKENEYESDKENSSHANITIPCSSATKTATPYLGPSTSTGIRKIKKEKVIKERKKRQCKSKIKKRIQTQIDSDSTSVSDCLSLHSDSDIYDCNETSEADLEPYKIDDHVLVRYYNRKKWTYYVGYIENVNKNDEDGAIFTIRFYKTLKNATEKKLKFTLTKKIDRDDVPMLSIVKKIQMKNDPNNSKELLLSNDDDSIYF